MVVIPAVTPTNVLEINNSSVGFISNMFLEVFTALLVVKQSKDEVIVVIVGVGVVVCETVDVLHRNSFN
ncbi:unnamed protein product [Heterobilharzia americana]|nr:unnamed protein product [Heterobilharzia americana]